MGEVGRRTNNQNCVRVDQTRNGTDVDLVLRRRAGDKVDFDFEVLGCLVECGMGGLRENPMNAGQLLIQQHDASRSTYISGSVTPRSAYAF